MKITSPCAKDAQALVNLHKSLSEQHPFVPSDEFEEDCRFDWITYHIQNQNKWLKIFVAKNDQGQIVGNAWVHRENTMARCHCAHIGIAILAEHCHQGIGTKFMQEIENWASEMKCIKLSAKVVALNLNAVSFFLKQGFFFETLERESYNHQGTLYVEYLMTKKIPPYQLKT